MNEERIIPKHWQIKKLGEVCNFIGGGTPSKKESSFWNGKIPWASVKDLKGNFLNQTIDFITEEGVKNSSTNIALKNELIVATRINPGKPIICKIDTAINQDLKIIKHKIPIDSTYLYYWFLDNEKKIIEKSSGTTVLGINLENLNQLEIPLPPLLEQQAIVAKIEELLSDLENGKQQLQLAQQQLKIYRQSLLKWAFEGKLTNKNVKEGELPEGWKMKKIREISSVLGDGLHGTPKYSETGEYFFINGNNLFDGKIVIKENTKRVSIEEYVKYKKPLNERTIFVSINGTLGNTAFYNNEKVILGKSACYFNLNDDIDKHYIRYFLTSNNFLSYANKNATGSTIKNVGLKAMREFKVPIPSTISDQHLIVDELESKLTVCDKIEETISRSLLQAESLKQSILKKAFEGRLV